MDLKEFPDASKTQIQLSAYHGGFSDIECVVSRAAQFFDVETLP
jgi:hypothetical protein